MSKHTNQSRFFQLGALIGLVTLSSATGCGEGTLASPESVSYALTGHVAGPYGSTVGTIQGPASNQLTAVTKIVGYHTSAYIYGIRLYWGNTSILYGQTNGVPGDTFDLTDDPVIGVKYVVSSGLLRGLKFNTLSDRSFELGLTSATAVAFSNSDALFTDLQIWKGTVNSTQTIVGAKLYYTTP